MNSPPTELMAFHQRPPPYALLSRLPAVTLDTAAADPNSAQAARASHHCVVVVLSEGGPHRAIPLPTKQFDHTQFLDTAAANPSSCEPEQHEPEQHTNCSWQLGLSPLS